MINSKYPNYFLLSSPYGDKLKKYMNNDDISWKKKKDQSLRAFHNISIAIKQICLSSINMTSFTLIYFWHTYGGVPVFLQEHSNIDGICWWVDVGSFVFIQIPLSLICGAEISSSTRQLKSFASFLLMTLFR